MNVMTKKYLGWQPAIDAARKYSEWVDEKYPDCENFSLTMNAWPEDTTALAEFLTKYVKVSPYALEHGYVSHWGLKNTGINFYVVEAADYEESTDRLCPERVNYVWVIVEGMDDYQLTEMVLATS